MGSRTGLRVAVVGCGYWGSKHVRVLNASDGVEHVAIVDGIESRVKGIQRQFPSTSAFTSLGAALPFVDAVVIATPPTTHTPLALEAIAAGRHVFVEKPLAPSVAEARKLIRAADLAGVVLMVGHTFEYNAAVWKLRELVQSRVLGDVYYIDSARLNLGLYQSDVNVIFDLAPHDVSIVNHVLGGPPVAVQAWAARHAHARFEDVAYLRLSYPNERLTANIHVSWLDPCKVRRVTAVGSAKMAVYDDLAPDERIRILDKGVLPNVGDDLSQPPMSYRYGDITAPYVAADEPLAVQDAHFVRCVANGLIPNTDGANGLAVVEVLEAAQLSLRLNRPVSLVEVQTEGPLTSHHPLDRRPAAPAHNRPQYLGHPLAAVGGARNQAAAATT